MKGEVLKHPFRTFFIACLILGPIGPVPALASAGEDTPKAADPLGQARDLVKAGQWAAALAELERIHATGDPDWNNLMGVASRRKDPPDFPAAERYYNAALAIDPKHRPTLEYLGELRLQQANLPAAEAVLDRLKKTTFFRSAEYNDLKEAIDRYKAAGHYVPRSTGDKRAMAGHEDELAGGAY
jgi:tetratricopeptide (TPR) repeat protein